MNAAGHDAAVARDLAALNLARHLTATLSREDPPHLRRMLDAYRVLALAGTPYDSTEGPA
jgi:hypothetical protein